MTSPKSPIARLKGQVRRIDDRLTAKSPWANTLHPTLCLAAENGSLQGGYNAQIETAALDRGSGSEAGSPSGPIGAISIAAPVVPRS